MSVLGRGMAIVDLQTGTYEASQNHCREACRWLRGLLIGLKWAVVGEGSSYGEAFADVKSAIRFHVETFGPEALPDDSPLLGGFRRGSDRFRLMAKFPSMPQSPE